MKTCLTKDKSASMAIDMIESYLYDTTAESEEIVCYVKGIISYYKKVNELLESLESE